MTLLGLVGAWDPELTKGDGCSRDYGSTLGRDISARTESILILKYFLPGLCGFSENSKKLCSKEKKKKGNKKVNKLIMLRRLED